MGPAVVDCRLAVGSNYVLPSEWRPLACVYMRAVYVYVLCACVVGAKVTYQRCSYMST